MPSVTDMRVYMKPKGHLIEIGDVLDGTESGIVPKVLLEESSSRDTGQKISGIEGMASVDRLEISQAGANCEGQTSKYGIAIDPGAVFHVGALDRLGIVSKVGWRRHDELLCSDDESTAASLCLMRITGDTCKRVVSPQEGCGKQRGISEEWKEVSYRPEKSAWDVKIKEKGYMRRS